MSGARRAFRTPFGSALLGGAIVGAFFWVAIAAGWIDAEGGSPSPIAAPLATPISDTQDEDTTLVNQIYRRDGQGVVFIAAQAPQEAGAPLLPFGEEDDTGQGL